MGAVAAKLFDGRGAEPGGPLPGRVGVRGLLQLSVYRRDRGPGAARRLAEPGQGPAGVPAQPAQIGNQIAGGQTTGTEHRDERDDEERQGDQL